MDSVCVLLPGQLLKWHLSRALDKALSLLKNVLVFSGFSTNIYVVDAR